MYEAEAAKQATCIDDAKAANEKLEEELTNVF
jgi:hypothetical protein